MPASLQIVASSSLIGREAFERSVSPRQKRSKPPPVPETPTVTWTFGSCGLELLGRRGRVRADRARAVRLDPAGEIAAAGAGGRSRAARLVVAAAAAAAAGEEGEEAEQKRNSRDRFSLVRHTASLACALPRRGFRLVKIR